MKIFWTKSAENDLNQIINYLINKEDLETAEKKYNDIKKKIPLLKNHPEAGRIVPELEILKIKKYREIIINPWRLIYKTDNKSIYILAILDSRRNLEDILFDRLIQ